MRRISNFLKVTLAAANDLGLPATASEMTLHDAIRICAKHAESGNACAAPCRTALRQIEVCRYRSEADLHDHWRSMDDAARQSANLTIVLELDGALRGNLRELIRRQRRAYRLVIVPRAGHWPGNDSFGDLALAASSLGWSFIEICRDLGEALESAVTAFGHDERLLVVLPACSQAA